jgi:peptidyl-prolyl isomerase E (cyclophilin E)
MSALLPSDPIAFNKKTILYVGGLDENVTEEVLLGAFQPFGELVQVLLPTEQSTSKLAPHHQTNIFCFADVFVCVCVCVIVRHRGYAFVEYRDPVDAAAALENMSDSELYGRVLRVNVAKPAAVRSQGVWSDADRFYDSANKQDGTETQ